MENKMTKHNILRIKLSVFSILFTLLAVYLDGIRKASSGMDSALAQYGEVMIAIIAIGFIITTIIYIFLDEDNA